MRHFIILFLSLLCLPVFATDIAPKDSLLQQLVRSNDLRGRAEVLRNLADVYYELPQEQQFLEKLISVAREIQDNELLLNTYSDLAGCYLKKLETDSARYCIDRIKKIEKLPAVAHECQLTYLRMRLYGAEIDKGGENGLEAIEQKLKEITTESQQDKTIYRKIEDAYSVADGYSAQKKFKEALPYATTALNLAAGLPFEDGIRIRMLIVNRLANLYLRNAQYDEATELVEKHLALYNQYYAQHLQKKRPFYPIESIRIANYGTLMINIRNLSPEKAKFYLQNIIYMASKTDRARDKYSCFLAMNNYYLYRNDYNNALSSNDSLIAYAKILAPYNVPSLHNLSSFIYEKTGNYKEALSALKLSRAAQDSLATAKSLEQLNKLQVQYDLNKLNYEKSQLEVRNKQIMVISLSIGLLIFIALSVYLNYNLKKEQAMKAHLRLLKTKAEESENMKTSFINSICHEIRTPLNSIVGFTDLIFNDSIDEELRRTFPEEIQKNTQLLTGLINSMLEVSNLDVSDEKLPCEPADVQVICRNEMDRLKISAKPGIDYLLDIPTEPLIISTNAQYLALVIENLLDNANKFTTSGSVTLKYHIDNTTNHLLISVTDTGIGIPEEKQQEIFDRFTKLDSFAAGNGLGLYLCRLIIKRLSGTIAVESTYREGTRMVISLPV